MYSENDIPDAQDLYGRSKLLGEGDYSNAITLRTSIIGHEMQSAHGLVEWFLSQSGFVKGYKRALFSGLPTVELATVIRDYVIPRPELHGVFHVSASPINKFDLLSLIAETYQKSIVIEPDENLVIDRSLDSSRFQNLTGYKPPSWIELIRRQHAFHLNDPTG
jgi:dTDP-4-dehydrorhamnose reductase